MNFWTTNTLRVSSPMTTMTTSASVSPKKVLGMEINSWPFVEYYY
jgi:hypothetical protein